jgi:hypothetical protein
MVKRVTVFFLQRDTARQWAEGKPDTWLQERLWHEGNFAVGFDLEGKWAWRTFARILRVQQPEPKGLTGWASNPILVKRYEGVGAEIVRQIGDKKFFWFEGESFEKLKRRLHV